MIYPKIPLAQSIIEICSAKGVHDIVISPGSRNAPLTIGFTNNKKFNCYSIADERCAGFFALGIAQQTKRPVAVVCTSGSALLNYYPAFAEAFYSQHPFIVISADRPKDKIDIGDGQTIRQENVFLNHSLYNANLTEDATEENEVFINEAINVAIARKGPVHINVPFEEPLYETTNKLSVDFNITSLFKVYRMIGVEDIIAFSTLWNHSKKILVIVGELSPNSIEQKWIEKLTSFPSVVVLTEANSNLHHPSFINNIDSLITPFSQKEFSNLQPRILITLGGMIVSKRIKAFVRNYKPRHHWHIDELRAYDTFGILTHHFHVSPNQFFSQFLPYVKTVESNYKSTFEAINQVRKTKREEYINKIPFSDLKVFDTILKTIPKNTQLQVSNSSAIRYVQLFDVDESNELFCNRGTSGIDGSTSTAIGAAVASNKPTVFITGDVSFFYDSNALWNNYIPKDFKIIVINNGGGGIFRILPGHQENETFNTFFETSHCLTAEHLAKMYRFNYLTASSDETLSKSLKDLFSNNETPTILEIFTPTKENDKILLQYFKELV
ncbi:2-succinyl-5-enolpyruvyl-6-hydroxy-3-cyclohexene-1-carboxylic-acid synthase [Flavobacterium capsici]|uniref:2-succinyl-5-enolpyruvyl-6-hydroxy-3-cyclohexene-1-carboxylate synthase n=1 Tax=Flavobacterium capsici TaxID=3075618 RepID=A0AA96J591_9FLAO|nr:MULTISPECIES: 2-succinyl-5-enolpyruvyl-6-hydroxy-3-cyclohexene-1-carboxylic-acid synthase [unclassified Flavobacterium]WNM18209.1 2-succinyl-5-enolpyruvyl-6-hydroxy-3-cyclohexene-1-carboxylic-acid synthase [Flavobacterium sp. PMR2A8]WNM22260.1 2-succinyl-5-enolpyruvyl-6-hydroxy-3-cyclohexene-1-carboxylic-acid synthase [Flavobacterium sp. PMTSA4]